MPAQTFVAAQVRMDVDLEGMAAQGWEVGVQPLADVQAWETVALALEVGRLRTTDLAEAAEPVGETEAVLALMTVQTLVAGLVAVVA